MKWPARAAWRCSMRSRPPSRCRNSTDGQCPRSWSRYLRLSAEQAMTLPLACAASHSPVISSHGQRSSSSSASPRDIFSTLARGCRSSASSYGNTSRLASASPTVDLPDPDTPITTTGWSRSAMPQR